jgi:hypothetical protein
LFPEIEILDEYELNKETDQEREENYEEESKASNINNTSRSDRPKQSIISRKYFLRFTHLGYDGLDDLKSGAVIDNLCEWPTCMREKQIRRQQLIEAESLSNISKDTRSVKNARAGKTGSAKKAPIVVKKLMNPVILYTEL